MPNDGIDFCNICYLDPLVSSFPINIGDKSTDHNYTVHSPLIQSEFSGYSPKVEKRMDAT